MAFLKFLQLGMEKPALFGWYHILWLLLMVAGCVLMCVFVRKVSEKTFRIILISASCFMIVFEVYKQIVLSVNTSGDALVWDYPAYIFPFQFCSTPMYVLLLAGIVKDGLIREALLSYSSTFALFAGLCVMLYPGDVFTTFIGINIQTMVVHSFMVVLGVFIISRRIKTYTLMHFLKGVCVFAIMVTVAIILNIVVYKTGLFQGKTFDMFFISPYFPCTLPILGALDPLLPYPVFLLIYILGFTLAAFILFMIAFTVNKYGKKISLLLNKKSKTESSQKND